MVIMTIGLLFAAVGIIVDIVVHARAPSLAAHEHVYSLRNPSHAMAGWGLGLLAIGLFEAWRELLRGEQPRVVRLRTRDAVAWFGASAVVVASLSAWAIADPGFAEAGCNVPEADAPAPAPGHRLSLAAQAALLHLSTPGAAASAAAAASASAGLSHSEHGPAPQSALSSGDQTALVSELACAQRTAEALSTPEAASAAGYVQASSFVAGVGEHWIDWRAVGKPFDPARPSMLLFGVVRHGQPPELVGLSYWVGSATVPDGFAGSNDQWHQHSGLCFQNGWLASQGPFATKDGCTGAWVDGRDLWMLHVWVAPDLPNRWGTFAVLNPALCPSRVGTPDILRCNPDTR
jgi:hypothetical protein